MKVEDKIKVWLRANVVECEKYAKKAAEKGEYKDAIELEGMAKAFKKAAIKVENTNWE